MNGKVFLSGVALVVLVALVVTRPCPTAVALPSAAVAERSFPQGGYPADGVPDVDLAAH